MTHRPAPRIARLLLALVCSLGGSACFDVTPDVPEGPSDVTPPRNVSVTVEYRQPNGCVNVSTPCEATVVFFGSWMRPGEVLLMQQDPHSFVWRGTSRNVPVNFPPRDEPYFVRVFDPHLRETPSGGVTAYRIKVGGEALVHFDSEGQPSESALVYIDENGVGHNPL